MKNVFCFLKQQVDTSELKNVCDQRRRSRQRQAPVEKKKAASQYSQDGLNTTPPRIDSKMLKDVLPMIITSIIHCSKK